MDNFAKSVIYDKQQWAAASGADQPIEFLNLDDKKYDVREYRFIRIDWQEKTVYGSNSTEAGSIWRVLPPVDAPPA